MMDAIYTYADYGQDSRPRLEFPKRTGKRTSYGQWLAYLYGLHHDGVLPAAGEERPAAVAFVNHGRWLWLCPGCLTAVQVCESGDGAALVCCPACFGQEFVQPVFPQERVEIEEELLRQPGYRWNAPFRNWDPGWSLAYLQERTAKAQAQIDRGETFVRAASVGTPRTWAVGEVLSAANMNTFVREIQKDLIGTNGAIELLHGVRPGSFSTAQINALSGIEDGTMLYNQSTKRHEYFVGGNRRGFAGVHTSGLFAAAEVVTVTHNLGFAPTSFQLLYERVASGAEAGHGNGDRVYVAQNRSAQAPGFAVFDVTATSYKVALIGAKETVIWAVTDGGEELWKIRADNASNLAGGFGDQGDLASGLLSPRGLTWFDDALWTMNSATTPRLWKLDPANPGRTDGGFGDQGALPGGGVDLISLFVWDGALWANEGNASRVSKIDHTSPGNTSGDFWDRESLATGVNWLTQYDGAVWGLRSAGRTIHRFDPTNWSNSGGGFGSQGTLPSGLASPKGLGAHNNAFWTINGIDESVWEIEPANPGNENEGFGRQEIIFSSLPTVVGIVAVEGDTVRTGYVTAASGGDAGFPVEIVVDNDAAAGGWGARMLAFA